MGFIKFSIPFLLLVFLAACGEKTTHKRVLLFSKTANFRHPSIEAGVEAIKALGRQHGFSVEATEDSAFITEENLKHFGAVVFLNTSGDVLNNWQQADFQRFIQAGGGFVGIHGAANTEYDWKWYGRLTGAYLDDFSEVQGAKIKAAGKGAWAQPDEDWQEEWFNFKPVPPANVVQYYRAGKPVKKSNPALDSLASQEPLTVPVRVKWEFAGKPFLAENIEVLLEAQGVKGSKHGASYPVAWRQEYDGGRSFYTGLGGERAAYSDKNFLNHLMNGIQFALGNKPLDYSKATIQRIPPEDRFVRTVLAENLNEPTELAVLPDGKIIVVERRGAFKIYNPDLDSIYTVCQMPVYDEFEEGLMGVALDPGYEKNHWIYIYYSLMEGGRRNRLSRFVFKDEMLHQSSEKILLEVPEQVGCCHTGGSIAFDKKGNLFLSTGDNTNPFESDGYAPIDERPGRDLYDGQRSSLNANNLRGKVLRITPQPDGSYSIPDGNLFPKGTPGTRPEIFVMGCRNPYRISVDSKTGAVLWGDVGPDAGRDGVRRGPKGYDTFNRALQPGNYGWPQFRGNHIYFDYNFSAKKAGQTFNPERPLNDSPNNTGIRELPPLSSPLIWYSYDESLEFPWVATGGKNPMSGPVFHAADFPAPRPVSTSSANRSIFPEYFENKWFVYEWMRNWIFIVTLDSAGNYVQADPFLPSEKFSRPMDMEFGNDGALYMLEYGQQWFAQNPDARLNKIEYAPGNRKPVAKIEASAESGKAPLKVKFYGGSSKDSDGDPLWYEWKVKGATLSTAPVFEHVFTTPGIYKVSLTVKDPGGATGTATREIVVGNTPPEVVWNIEGNQTFFFDNQELNYHLDVEDPEEGSLGKGSLSKQRLRVSMDYLAQGQDVAAIVMGHQTQSSAGSLRFAKGKLLIEKSDCKTCHAEEKKVNGPSYIDIANRYYGSEFAAQTLSTKVIKGGGGNWGETPMSAHPNITLSEAEAIVKYILSLAGEVQPGADLAEKGTYKTDLHLKDSVVSEEGSYVFQASYRDEGSPVAFTGRKVFLLRHPKLEAERCDFSAKGIRKMRLEESDTFSLGDIFDGRWFGWKEIDLTGVGSVQIGLLAGEQWLPGSSVEVRAGSPLGEILGTAPLEAKTTVPIKANSLKMMDLYFVFRNEQSPGRQIGKVDWVWFGRRE